MTTALRLARYVRGIHALVTRAHTSSLRRHTRETGSQKIATATEQVPHRILVYQLRASTRILNFIALGLLGLPLPTKTSWNCIALYYGRCIMADILPQTYYNRCITADILRQMFYGRCITADISRQIYYGRYITTSMARKALEPQAPSEPCWPSRSLEVRAPSGPPSA